MSRPTTSAVMLHMASISPRPRSRLSFEAVCIWLTAAFIAGVFAGMILARI